MISQSHCKVSYARELLIFREHPYVMVLLDVILSTVGDPNNEVVFLTLNAVKRRKTSRNVIKSTSLFGSRTVDQSSFRLTLDLFVSGIQY